MRTFIFISFIFFTTCILDNMGNILQRPEKEVPSMTIPRATQLDMLNWYDNVMEYSDADANNNKFNSISLLWIWIILWVISEGVKLKFNGYTKGLIVLCGVVSFFDTSDFFRNLNERITWFDWLFFLTIYAVLLIGQIKYSIHERKIKKMVT